MINLITKKCIRGAKLLKNINGNDNVIFLNRRSNLIALIFGVTLFMFSSSPTFAEQANASQKAMKIAEQQTQGKAVNTKYFEQGGQKGYKVRILKDGKVSHIFISLSQLK